MMREVLFLVSSFLVCWNGVHPFLDVDELKNIHYDIDIVDKPVLLGRPSEQEVIYMTSKYGQRYECQLPDITELELEMEEEKAASEIGVSELLKAMESAPCIRKTKDWWSYEFCYGKHIQQFHLEKEEIVGDIVILGVYDSETDWGDNATTDSRKNRLNRYHSQHYVNGSTCDINGKPRQAEVRFHCAEGEGDSISRIDEPTTCTYILTIHTTKICHHPYLKPPPKVKPKSVLCSPALTQHQFDVYRYHEEQAELKIQQAQERLKQKKEEELQRAQQILGISTKSKVSKEDEEDDEVEDEDEYEEATDREEDLDTILKEYSDNLKVDNLDEAISMGVDPKVLAEVIRNIVDSVQDSVNAIDEELDDTDFPPEEEEEGEEQHSDVAVDLDHATSYVANDELEQFEFKKLLSELRDGIDEAGMGEDEAERMQALADELERSYDDVDALEKLLMTEDIEKTLDDEDSSKTKYEDSGEDLTGKTSKEMEDMLVSKVNELISKLKADPEADDSSELDETDTDDSDDTDSNKVKIKVTRVKLNRETGADVTEKDVNLFDPEQRSLEEAIQDHLDQAGIQVEGGKIELKVLTYKPDDWPDDGEGEGSITILTEEETTYFKNIVSGILGHHGQNEEARHERLQQSYRFHWDRGNHRIIEEADTEDEQNTNDGNL